MFEVPTALLDADHLTCVPSYCFFFFITLMPRVE